MIHADHSDCNRCDHRARHVDSEPAAQHDSTAPATAIAHSDTTIAPVTSTGGPAAQVNYAALPGDVTALPGWCDRPAG